MEEIKIDINPQEIKLLIGDLMLLVLGLKSRIRQLEADLAALMGTSKREPARQPLETNP